MSDTNRPARLEYSATAIREANVPGSSHRLLVEIEADIRTPRGMALYMVYQELIKDADAIIRLTDAEVLELTGEKPKTDRDIDPETDLNLS